MEVREKKRVREWLAELPEDLRCKAAHNVLNQSGNFDRFVHSTSPYDALTGMFIFHLTPEGNDFWANYNYYARKNKNL